MKNVLIIMMETDRPTDGQNDLSGCYTSNDSNINDTNNSYNNDDNNTNSYMIIIMILTDNVKIDISCNRSTHTIVSSADVHPGI